MNFANPTRKNSAVNVQLCSVLRWAIPTGLTRSQMRAWRITPHSDESKSTN